MRRPAFLLLIAATVLAAVSAAAAHAPAPKPAPTGDAPSETELMIDAGRFGVMLEQADEALKLATAAPIEEPRDTRGEQDAYILHDLRSAVLRYNVMQFEACSAGVIQGRLCDSPYLPDWLRESADTKPPSAEIAARVRDAAAHIEPLWSALCARGVAASGNEAFCAIE